MKVEEVKVSRLMFSALESNADGNKQFNLRERVMNSTIGGSRGLAGFQRMDAYSQVCENFDRLLNSANKKARFINSAATYADSAEAVGQISVGIDATIRAYTDSIAGFLCREESISAPNALVTIFDAVDAFDDTIISPNLGPVNYGKLRNSKPISGEVTASDGTYTFIPGKRILGRTVKMHIFGTAAGSTEEVEIPKRILQDDGLGNLMAAAGVLTAGAVDYANGVVTWTLAGTITVDTVVYTPTKVMVEVCIDMTGDAASAGTRTHIKGKQVGFLVETAPELLTYEQNLIENLSVSKTLGSDMTVYLSERLAELYTIRINTMAAEAIDDYQDDDTYTINFSAVSFDNTRSYSDYFYNKLSEAMLEAKEKVYRLGEPNVILAGNKGIIPFRKLTQIGVFTKVKSSHVVGLVGYLDDVTPVIQSDVIKEDAAAVNPEDANMPGEGIFYMGYKSTDGTIAPLLRVIYLPLTTTPNVGNFANPVQTSGGYYYAESMYPLYRKALKRCQVFGASKY
jgi:hypothetical protein